MEQPSYASVARIVVAAFDSSTMREQLDFDLLVHLLIQSFASFFDPSPQQHQLNRLALSLQRAAGRSSCEAA